METMYIAINADNEEKFYFLDEKSFEDAYFCIDDKEDFQEISSYVEGDFEEWEKESFIKYWDGSNWKVQWISDYIIDQYEEIENYIPKPAYYFQKKIKSNGIEIVLHTSNCTPGITPFWMEPENI